MHFFTLFACVNESAFLPSDYPPSSVFPPLPRPRSSCQTHITDVTNASRTLLMNLSTLAWDDAILRILRIPKGR